MTAAAQNPFQKALYSSLALSLDMYINMLFEYKKHLSMLENEIDVLAKSIQESKIIQSIPGIGEKSLPRLFLKSVRLIGLITLRNWLPTLELTLVFIHLESLQQRRIG